MRIVFMGTPAYAVPSLKLLAESSHDVVAVYTRADAKRGRGSTLYPSDVKAAAEELGLSVYTPSSLRDEEVQRQIASFAPDVIAVAAFGMILPKEVLEIPRYGCLNVHGSALPRWRGAAPVQRAILAQDANAGVCIMQMEEGLDTGDYHSCGTVEIGSMTTAQLTESLAHMGAKGLLEAVDALEGDEDYLWVAQDEDQVTYANKIEKTDTLLEPSMAADSALRCVQASSASAPARCIVCGKEVTVIGAAAAEESLACGEVLLQKKRIIIGFSQGAMELQVVKPQGKKEMPVQGWINGLRNAEPVWGGIHGR